MPEMSRIKVASREFYRRSCAACPRPFAVLIDGMPLFSPGKALKTFGTRAAARRAAEREIIRQPNRERLAWLDDDA